jgi:restriction system protein
MKKTEVPTFDELMGPTVEALKRLGGSASIDELVPEIVRLLDLPQEIAEVPHGASGRTELEYRSAWARTYLRKAGLLENPERGIWALTPFGSQTTAVDGRRIAREVSKQFQAERTGTAESEDTPTSNDAEAVLTWQEKLLSVLQAMDPIAFERLCQRILRESGFIEVEVTKRSGDGGIDGYGTIRLGGLISSTYFFRARGTRAISDRTRFATFVVPWSAARIRASSSVRVGSRWRRDVRPHAMVLPQSI